LLWVALGCFGLLWVALGCFGLLWVACIDTCFVSICDQWVLVRLN